METFQLLSRIIVAMDTFAHALAFVLVFAFALLIVIYAALTIWPASVKQRLSGVATSLQARVGRENMVTRS